ncbi:MAG: LysR substrate-binding domain-containing protein, partial [Sciscionella sp.]
VAETGSVRAAAERLVVTQAAVSSSLTALQRSLGVTLLRRDGRGIRLTDAGTIYADYVRRVLGLLTEAKDAAAGEVDPGSGRLRVAAITTAGEQILPRLLASFRAHYPEVDVSLGIGNREHIRALLENHDVDLVLSGRPQQGAGHLELQTQAVRRNELVVVAPASAQLSPELPWSARCARLAERTWLLREYGSGTRMTTEALFDRLEISPSVLTLGSNGAVRESVVAGLGVSLMSRDAVAHELATGVVTEVATPATPLRRDWHLVSHRGRLPATAALFVRHVLEAGDFHTPRRPPRRGEAARTSNS